MTARARYAVCCAVVAAVFFSAQAARADDENPWEKNLTGDWGGARQKLKDKGVEVGLIYIGETLSILSGGLRRGTSYEGRLEASIQISGGSGKPFLWDGATVFGKAYQIHSARGLNAADYVGSISDPSNIDALATTRLFTLWFEQAFGDIGSIRIGQLAADDEFLTSATAGGLINGTFGWASMFAANLPSGGPAYPLATPGVRVELKSGDWLARAAVFSGDPAGRNCNDLPQACNRYGTTFSFDGGAFWIGELQYQHNNDEKSVGWGHVFKVGAWYHSGSFADQRFGVDPMTGLVVSQALGVDPLYHRGNRSFYGVTEHVLRQKDGTSVGLFARGGVLPSDRNLISWYVDGGIGWKGVLGRADDVFTVGVAYNNISRDAAALDQDMAILNPPYPIRSSEIVFEASYTWQVKPWWTIQPDIQYIVRPGGNVPDPVNPLLTVGNAFVVGARSTVTF